MSRRAAAKKEEGSSGLGFLGALAVAGGAAAIGFMANDLWKSFQEMSAQEQQLRNPPPQHTPARSPSQPSEQEKRQARQQRSSSSNETIPEGHLCVVCFDNKREYVLDPCGHVALCMDCGDQLNLCPICNTKILNKKFVYVS